MAQHKVNATGRMRIRAYEVPHRAIEDGAAYGWRCAHEHTDKPAEGTIKPGLCTELRA